MLRAWFDCSDRSAAALSSPVNLWTGNRGRGIRYGCCELLTVGIPGGSISVSRGYGRSCLSFYGTILSGAVDALVVWDSAPVTWTATGTLPCLAVRPIS